MLSWELNLRRSQILELRYWLIVGKLEILAVRRVDLRTEEESVLRDIRQLALVPVRRGARHLSHLANLRDRLGFRVFVCLLAPVIRFSDQALVFLLKKVAHATIVAHHLLLDDLGVRLLVTVTWILKDRVRLVSAANCL